MNITPEKRNLKKKCKWISCHNKSVFLAIRQSSKEHCGTWGWFISMFYCGSKNWFRGLIWHAGGCLKLIFPSQSWFSLMSWCTLEEFYVFLFPKYCKKKFSNSCTCVYESYNLVTVFDLGTFVVLMIRNQFKWLHLLWSVTLSLGRTWR